MACVYEKLKSNDHVSRCCIHVLLLVRSIDAAVKGAIKNY